jgi:hypothetical protein
MKMRLLPVLLLLSLSACGTDPNAVRTPDTGTSSASPTLTSASPTSSETSPTAATVSPTTTVGGIPVGSVVTQPDVTFSSADQITSVTWLTADAKTFLVSELKRVQSVDGSCAQVIISGYRVPDLLNGWILPCHGGYLVLWGKFSSGWKIVISGQAVPACSDIRKTGWKTTIPHDFMGGQCMEGSSAIDYKP